MTTEVKELNTEAMSAARMRLIFDHPFWGSLALRLKLEATHDIPTACTDGVSLKFNPDYFDQLHPVEQEFLVAHEVEHCVLEHCWRMKGRDHDLSNEAADHVVNLDLLPSFPTLPPQGEIRTTMLADPEFSKMSFEKVYMILESRAKKNPQNGSGTPGQGKPQPGSGKQPINKRREENLGNSGSEPGKPGENGNPGTGSGSPGNFGGIELPPETIGEGDNKMSRDDVQHEWHKAVETAQMVASKAGTMPGNTMLSVKEVRRQSDDLVSELQQFITLPGSHSFARPDRRLQAHGYKLPGRIKSRTNHAVFVVDTSASTKTLLPMFKEKVNQIMLLDEPPELITVVYCDTQIQSVERFTDGQIQFNPPGGGGTSFAPSFPWLENGETIKTRRGKEEVNEVPPDFVVYLTDLFGQDSDKTLPEPSFPVLWVAPITSRDSPWERVPNWGRKIYVDPFE